MKTKSKKVRERIKKASGVLTQREIAKEEFEEKADIIERRISQKNVK